MTAESPRAAGPDFAALLHERRRAAGLTQTDLAELAGLAVRTVREVERGRTARVQRTTAVLLADALGLEGEDRNVFLAAARGEGAAGRGGGPGPARVPHPRAAAVRGAPLPPAPALVGREEQLTRLADQLRRQDGPMAPLSLVGIAGVGKSTLALALVHRVADRFPGGAGRIAVAHGAATAELLDAVADRFGLADAGQLPERFGAGSGLLLVEAVERAPGAVAAALGRLPPDLAVITTGRRALGLPGERVWPVVPLAVPPAGGQPDLVELRRYPAVELLCERLAPLRRETSPAYCPTLVADDELPALVGLVRRVGGLPLAVELLAAQGRLLRLPEILERYGDRVLDLGAESAGGQSVRAAVAGSYHLLTPQVQRVLRRLSTFRGRWSVDLAEQLLAEPPGWVDADDPLPVLDQLVSLGLVEVRGVGENRFRLLDVVRDFAVEQAGRRGELPAARRAHAVVVARWVGRVVPELSGTGAAMAVAKLDDLAGELWSALNHAANDDPPTALRLASGLVAWWRFRGQEAVGSRWLRRLLDDPRTSEADPVARAWARLGLARLARSQGAGAAELTAAEAARDEFQRLGEVSGELAANATLAELLWAHGRYQPARERAEAVLVAATRAGRLRDAANAQLSLWWHEVRVGDLAAARRRLTVVDRLAAQAGDQRLRVLAAADAAELARWEGRCEEAVAVGGRVLARLGELGDAGQRQQVLATLGRAFAASGRLAEADRAVSALRAECTAPLRSPAAEGVLAAVEGWLAMARGDLERAQDWWAAAAAAFRDGAAGRELVESLACLAVVAVESRSRKRALAELRAASDADGFALLPAELALLGRAVPGWG